MIINNKLYMLLPNHDCERGHAVLAEHIYVVFLSPSLYIFGKIVVDLVFE